jgi:RsiW-degrading membrane proteinase PrsW (M82 family)
MALWTICEQCHKRVRTKGNLVEDTFKCPQCGHLQYLAEMSAPAATSRSSLLLQEARGLTACPTTFQQLDALFDSTRAPVTATATAEPSANGSTATSAAPRPTPAPAAAVAAAPTGGVGDYLYWFLVLSLIPLAISVVHQNRDVKQRFDDTERANPAIFSHYEKREDANLDDLLNALPGQRIQGAYLPRDTSLHWLYAGVSGVVYLCFIVMLFPGRATNPRDLFLIGLFTSTFGVFMLLAVQFVAFVTEGIWFTGAGSVTAILWILKFIAFSYRSALDPDSNFVLSFLGFTFGVGLCEELVKSMPLIWYYRNCERMTWRGACRWGLASGVGFGVAEGITYAADFYNGIQTMDMYIVRFVSCVALHGIWSASVGITLWKCQDLLQRDVDWYELIVPILRILAVAMVLHGLYDTLLKMEIDEFALVVAVISFAWLAWQIETLREKEKVLALAAVAA